MPGARPPCQPFLFLFLIICLSTLLVLSGSFLPFLFSCGVCACVWMCEESGRHFKGSVGTTTTAATAAAAAACTLRSSKPVPPAPSPLTLAHPPLSLLLFSSRLSSF